MEEANYVCQLPCDYFHVLNCTVHFKKKNGADSSSKCPDPDDDGNGGIFSLCRRLTANQYPALIHNAYLKPTYKRPYFYINESTASSQSVALEESQLLEPCAEPSWKKDLCEILDPCGGGTCTDCTHKLMEIRCGKNKGYTPNVAYVDYLRIPKIIELT